MEPFKNLYNKKSLSEMAKELSRAWEGFDERGFLKFVNRGLSNLEMKERVVQIAQGLESYLPGPYKKNVTILLKTLKKDGKGLDGFLLWPYTFYIETRGLSSFQTSMDGLFEITKCFTSEFGVRPFFEKYPDRVYKVFTKWATHEDEHIRRWVSEGTRPNLPWGQNISHLQDNVRRNIALLDLLKADPSLYVRKSVANHLNDISWFAPDLVIETLKKWRHPSTPEMEWIQKQALRSLIKKGDTKALRFLGYNPGVKCSLEKLKLSRKTVKEGETFFISFQLTNLEKGIRPFMVDYVIMYPKANGRSTGKTFKLKSLDLRAGETLEIRKKVNFKKVTTRTHYPGTHRVQIQVNGAIQGEAQFNLRV